MKKTLVVLLTLAVLVGTMVIGTSAAKPAAGSWANVYGATVTDGAKGTSLSFDNSIMAMRAGYTSTFNLDGFRMQINDIVAPAGTAIPITIGNSALYSWYDQPSFTMVLDPSKTTGALTIQPNQIATLPAPDSNIGGDMTTAVGTSLYIAFDKVDANNWTLTLNNDKFTIPDSFISKIITDTTKAGIGMGGDWNWGTGDKNVSYTITDMSNYAPYTVNVGTKNVAASDFVDQWGMGTGFTDAANGVKVVSTTFGQRITTKKASSVDGLDIKITDFNFTAMQDASQGVSLAFTLTSAPGGFTSGGDGIFFRLNQSSNGQVMLAAGLAKDSMDTASKRLIDATLGGSFAKGFPTDIEIKVAKNGTNYDISLNDQVFSLPVSTVDPQICDDKTALVSFGGWCALPAGGTYSYTLNYITPPPTPASSATSSITTSSSASSTTKVPNTSDNYPIAIVWVLTSILGMSLIIFGKVRSSNK